MPVRKMYIASGMVRWVMLPTFIRLVPELSDEITTTKAIPSIKNNIFLYFPFKTFFSSATTIGIANGDDVKEAFDILQSYAESKSK